ncbi:MAG: hypothetical protein ABI318_11965 [Chthoniobacteraceae bacterium]
MNRLALSILLAGLLSSAHAQLDVTMELKRNIFMRGEPIEATVNIRNLAGKDVILRDTDGNQWFSFEIMKGSDTPIGPRGNYRNEPQVILNGASIRRSVDLLRLYPVNEYGTYTVRAAIYFQETGKFISSAPFRLDISEGRKLWTQTVGVPGNKEGAGEYRVMSLLAFQQPKEMTLYARIEDQASGASYGTYPLGRMVSATPGHEFDQDNTLYVFHMVGPGLFALSKIGCNGEWLGQTMWHSEKGRAAVRKKSDGRMVIVGATRAVDKPVAGPEVPRLSDRPVALPK